MKTSRRSSRPAKKPKDYKKIKSYMKKRLALIFFLVALALFGLAIVIARLDMSHGDAYEKTVLAQQTYASGTTPFKRGEITDRNGTVLAGNEAVYNLILDPSVICSDENMTKATLQLLSECFGYDQAELEKTISEKPNSRYIRYARQLSGEQKADFESRKDAYNKDEENKKNDRKVDGVWFETEYKRVYPYSTLACDLIGFSSQEGTTGNYGLEQYYNDELAGVPGRTYGSINEDSDAEKVVKPAVDGNTIVSTIDVNLQNIVENQIRLFNERIGSKNTAVVIMDPNNAEVLAMASYPYYDLNDPSDLTVSGYFTEEQINAMTDDEKVDTLNEIWKNYVTQTTYEPGSTAKPLTIAAGLEEGKLKTTDTYECDGGWDIPGGGHISCHKASGHGTLDVEGAIVESCNDALMQIGWQIGADVFCKYQPIFGLGDRTGIDLPGEETGILKKEEDMSQVDLATNSFGQNFNVTIIQMAAVYCSLVNGGDYYTPHVVKEILSPDGAVVKSVDKTLVRKTISESTSSFLKTAMLAMVDNQGSYSTAIPGYEIGGKTGTAEKIPRSEHKYIVSFCTFVPASNPQYVMMVVIDEPNVENQSEGGHVTTLTHDLWVDILPYLNLYPTREGAETQASTENVLQQPAEEPQEAQQPEGEAPAEVQPEENPPAEDPRAGEAAQGGDPNAEAPPEDGEGYENGMIQEPDEQNNQDPGE